MFTSQVERVFEAAHSNGPPGHKCLVSHGHSWRVVVDFAYGVADLDSYGWGPDFGAIKKVIDRLDHQNLNALFDFPPSAENIAKWLWHALYDELGISPTRVVVHEGGGNSVEYKNDDD